MMLLFVKNNDNELRVLSSTCELMVCMWCVMQCNCESTCVIKSNQLKLLFEYGCIAERNS